MRFLLFIFMFLQIGCATKYLIATNRFMTPESQGGALNGQFELMVTSGNQLTADLSNASVNDGVNNQLISRTGFLFSTSLLDQIDLFWTHIGSGNTLLGAKYQFLGTSRTGKGTGHKMAISAAFGGNSYETEGGTTVDFELKGSEFLFLYGFRFSEMILAYSTFSYANYSFAGKVNSTDATINGLAPEYQTKVMALYGGFEADVGSFFGKLEFGYQQLQTTDTKDIANFIYGYSVGVSW